MVRQGSFLEQRQWKEVSERHDDIDYIDGYRVDRAGVMMSRVWKIAVVIADGFVEDVLVSSYLDGP
jgi:hypothetical protein